MLILKHDSTSPGSHFALVRLMALACLVVGIIWLTLAHARTAWAGGTVTNCSDDSDLSAKLSTGGLVTFDCGPNPPVIVLSSTQTIAHDTIIDGSNNGSPVTLSGGGVRQLLVVNSNVSLALSHLTLTGGYWLADGGAIYNNGRLSIDDCQLLDNHTAVTGSGGAIVSYGALTITNSTLAFNSAANGGALYPRFSGARTLIVNSQLHDNSTTSTSAGLGGALLSWGDGPVTIEGSTLYSNTAQAGGALFGIEFSVFNLTDITVTNNIATLGTGGGLELLGSAVISASRILSNTAHYTDTSGMDNPGGGGGIAIGSGGNVTVDSSLFEYNVVTHTTGFGVYVVGGAIMNSGSLTMVNSSLSRNFAYDAGGGLATAQNASLSHMQLAQNSTLSSAGAIYALSGTLSVSDTIFTGNSVADDSFDFGGGAVAISEAGAVSISDSSFMQNHANVAGAIANGGMLTVTASVIISSSSAHVAGAIGNFSQGTLILDRVEINASHAISDGGAVYNSNSLRLLNSTLSGNISGGHGGAIYTRENLVAINSTISGNRADWDGGGIYNVVRTTSTALTNIYNLTIADNVADAAGLGQGTGGGLFNGPGGTLNLRNTLMTGNTINGSTPDDCSGTLRSYRRNLVSSVGVSCTIVNVSGNWFYLNGFPPLGPLADNGGPTLTHALLPGTNAIDGGDPVQGCVDDHSVLLPADQRGVARPQGAACDVGAYEFQGQVSWSYLPMLVR